MTMPIRIGSWVFCAGVALLPLAFLSGEAPVPAADHLDPPARTDPSSDSSPDIPADIADIYAFHDADSVAIMVTFGGPAATTLPARYDPDVLLAINISNRPPRTTPDEVITFQFGTPAGSPDGPYGVRVRGLPGVGGDLVGPVETDLEKDGVKVRAGLFDDPFFFDLQGFRETVNTGTLSFRSDRNFFANQNITAVVVEIPRERLEVPGSPLDLWTTTSRLGGQLGG
jgi:hypothetical protein